MGLFGRKASKVLTPEEAVHKISTLVSDRDFDNLQSRLRYKTGEVYRAEVKRWASEHENPEVNKIGRSL